MKSPCPRVSVILPARNEERVLPITLPAVVRAAEAAHVEAEVLVVVPPTSPLLDFPPLEHPDLRWVTTPGPGKFRAFQVGVEAARGDLLLFVDADVLVSPHAFRALAQPLLDGTADVVAGRIELLLCATSSAQRRLEQWAHVSFQTWHEMRLRHPELLWALPGAVHGMRREFFPAQVLVPLVEDVSMGIQAQAAGARFAYVPEGAVRTPAPENYWQWARQKYRSRRGWAILARSRADEVRQLEAALRVYRPSVALEQHSSRVMLVQDAVLRTAARAMSWIQPVPSGAWSPVRGSRTWQARLQPPDSSAPGKDRWGLRPLSDRTSR